MYFHFVINFPFILIFGNKKKSFIVTFCATGEQNGISLTNYHIYICATKTCHTITARNVDGIDFPSNMFREKKLLNKNTHSKSIDNKVYIFTNYCV